MKFGKFINSFVLRDGVFRSPFCGVVISREKVGSNGGNPVFIYLFSDDKFRYAYKGTTSQMYLDMMDKLRELYKKEGYEKNETNTCEQLTLF